MRCQAPRKFRRKDRFIYKWAVVFGGRRLYGVAKKNAFILSMIYLYIQMELSRYYKYGS